MILIRVEKNKQISPLGFCYTDDMDYRVLYLVDGENLVLRYQDMLKDGRKPSLGVKYEEDSFVWHPRITQLHNHDLIRISYYTTCIGDDLKIKELSKKISLIKYGFVGIQGTGSGSLNPHIFKKEKRSQKIKSVDINITIDALRHTYNNSIDGIYIFAGDGDYLPLIKEVMRQGKQVTIGAFSKGFNSELQYECDDFMNLDQIFFE